MRDPVEYCVLRYAPDLPFAVGDRLSWIPPMRGRKSFWMLEPAAGAERRPDGEGGYDEKAFRRAVRRGDIKRVDPWLDEEPTIPIRALHVVK